MDVNTVVGGNMLWYESIQGVFSCLYTSQQYKQWDHAIGVDEW